MGKALFDRASFITAARALAGESGPAAVTVDSLIERVGSPKGSFYHRFSSRDLLMGELWLQTVLDYQQGFIQAIEANDGLAAALHAAVWSRAHLNDARLLMLYSRHDFVAGAWPEQLRKGVREQARTFADCLAHFARTALGSSSAASLRRATFVLAEAPVAAVKSHLQRHEAPPPIVDELITSVYRAIVP
jgi:AcrR family transcriptional regulator